MPESKVSIHYIRCRWRENVMEKIKKIDRKLDFAAIE
jgi:hypothetical protein